jgi:hypothetical protein
MIELGRREGKSNRLFPAARHDQLKTGRICQTEDPQTVNTSESKKQQVISMSSSETNQRQ